MNTHISRREFLGGTAGLTLILPIGASAGAMAQQSYSPNVWVAISTDGTITIVSPAAEMGQGTLTSLPAIIADELDADWSKVRTTLPPQWIEKNWGNPSYNGAFQTSASASIHGYFKPLRMAGAQARRVLLDAMADRWNVPVG